MIGALSPAPSTVLGVFPALYFQPLGTPTTPPPPSLSLSLSLSLAHSLTLKVAAQRQFMAHFCRLFRFDLEIDTVSVTSLSISFPIALLYLRLSNFFWSLFFLRTDLECLYVRVYSCLTGGRFSLSLQLSIMYSRMALSVHSSN